jgi:hypothetical protein
MFQWILNLFKKNKNLVQYDSEDESLSGYAEPSYSSNSEFSSYENPLEDYFDSY